MITLLCYNPKTKDHIVKTKDKYALVYLRLKQSFILAPSTVENNINNRVEIYGDVSCGEGKEFNSHEELFEFLDKECEKALKEKGG